MSALTAGCPSRLSPPAEAAPAQDPAPFVGERNGRKYLDLVVRGASCGGCLSKIENGVGKLAGVETARLNLSTGRMRVEWTGRLQARTIVETIIDLGYGVAAFDPGQPQDAGADNERRLMTALVVAGVATAAVMFFSEPQWFGSDLGDDSRALLRWMSAFIAIPAAVFSGTPFFSSAVASVRHRRLNMDVPVSLAVILALALSVYETIVGGRHAFFDASVMLLFFLLIGRVLDARLRRRAYAAANALAAMQSTTSTRLNADGMAEAVRASEIRPGDILLLAAGERLAVDAEVVSGDSEVDLRMVTGEVEPTRTQHGLVLHAGAVNLSAPLKVRATAIANDSLMADIARLLEAGEQRKSSYRKLADRAAEAYVPQVHAVAALGFAGWLIFGATATQAAYIAVTVLIITCPCALALAAPLVQVVAAGRLFREGIYLSAGDALERLAVVDHVVFDKTGTLTLGEPVLRHEPGQEEMLRDAARLARASHHPFSRALVRVAGAGPVAEELKEHPGQGVTGIIDGRRAWLGSAAFVGVQSNHQSELWFRKEGSAAAVFRFEDHLREDAAATIRKLRGMGLEIEIMSGDSEERVGTVAAACGILQWVARATPQSKARRLQALEASGQKVLMVGDGLNDAGALAGAFASMAPGGAVDVARLASDCVFSGDRLEAVFRTIEIARSARRRMRENFALAALYNLLAVPIALAGWVTPLIAAVAMSASSAIVTLNALRLSGHRSGVEPSR